MPTAFDDAVQALARVPLASFVAERKRQVAALRAAGDKAGAKALAERRRPTMSAWAVNQLHWQEQATLDALIAAAGRLRDGDRSAAAAHREALAALRNRAAVILADAGHAANEAVLRRVTTTLSALAVAGGFAPDLPGALTDDREPPGFEAMATSVLAPVGAPGAADHRTEDAAADVARRAAAAAERTRLAAEEAERHARARRAAERQRLEAELARAQQTHAAREQAVVTARDALQAADDALAASRRDVAELERALAALADDAE